MSADKYTLALNIVKANVHKMGLTGDQDTRIDCILTAMAQLEEMLRLVDEAARRNK